MTPMPTSKDIEKLRKEISNLGVDPAILDGVQDFEALSSLGVEKLHPVSQIPLQEFMESFTSLESHFAPILADFNGLDGDYHKITRLPLSEEGGDFGQSRRFRNSLEDRRIDEIRFKKSIGDDYNGKTCSINDKISYSGKLHVRGNGRKA
jgi:hypothetical protein